MEDKSIFNGIAGAISKQANRIKNGSASENDVLEEMKSSMQKYAASLMGSEHAANDKLLQEMNESLQQIEMRYTIMAESLVHIEQNYTKGLKEINESIDELVKENLNTEGSKQQVTSENSEKVLLRISKNLNDLEASVNALKESQDSAEKIYDESIIKINENLEKLQGSMESLQKSQSRIEKEMGLMQEILRLSLLNKLIDEVPTELEPSNRDVSNDFDATESEIVAGKTAVESYADTDDLISEHDNVNAYLSIGLKAEKKGNFEKAAVWYRKAADAGDSIAMRNLANMYRCGKYFTQNYKEARKWYTKASEAGDTDAMRNLGMMYQEGEGVRQNYSSAIKMYKKAADLGDYVAMLLLAHLYREGTGVPKNVSQALALYKQAGENGDADAMFFVGTFYEDGWGDSRNINTQEAVIWFRRSADAGDTYAMNKLGYMYQHGGFFKIDYEEAVKWYERAINAEEPNPFAMCNLGWMYEQGEGVEQNFDKAWELYQQAIVYDYKEAQEDADRVSHKVVIFRDVRSILSEQLDVDEDDIELEDDIYDDLDAQPNDFDIIIVKLEESFGIEITGNDLSEVQTVGELIEHIWESRNV